MIDYKEMNSQGFKLASETDAQHNDKEARECRYRNRTVGFSIYFKFKSCPRYTKLSMIVSLANCPHFFP